MNNLILAETILSGILGLICLSSIIIIIYIMRNYRLIEQQKESTGEFQKRIEDALMKLLEEEKHKGDD